MYQFEGNYKFQITFIPIFDYMHHILQIIDTQEISINIMKTRQICTFNNTYKLQYINIINFIYVSYI